MTRQYGVRYEIGGHHGTSDTGGWKRISDTARTAAADSIAQKLAIISECLQPGASLAGLVLAHQVNANMVRKWW